MSITDKSYPGAFRNFLGEKNIEHLAYTLNTITKEKCWGNNCDKTITVG